MSDAQPGRHTAGYITDVDGLRALAVVAVLAFHFLPGTVGGGFLGVDIFFVISGFVISRILLSEVQEGRFSLAAFYRRRAIRLLPALLTVLYACAVAGATLLFADEFSALSRYIGAGLAFVTNALSWHETGYFDHEAVTKPLLHLWSLGVEAQFYLLWPFVIARFGRDAGRFPWVLAAITAGSFLASLSLYTHYPELEFYGPFTRIWEFALGCAVAYQRRDTPKQGPDRVTMQRGTEYLWLCLMVGLLSSLLLMEQGSGAVPVMRLMAVVASAALLSMSGRSVLSQLCLSNPVARWLGKISYPLYLWHWPLLSFYLIVVGQRPSGTTSLALCLIAVALAWLTYRYIERPFQHWTRSPARRAHGLRLAGALACILFAAMLLSLMDDGWQSRGAQYVRALQQLDWPYKADADCAARFETPPPYCLAVATTRPNGVAIIGDSVSNALFPGVVRAAHSDMAVWNLGKPGCPPLAQVEKQVGSSVVGCVSPISNTLGFVVSERTISTVIISGSFAAYVTGRSLRAGGDAAPMIKLSSSTLMAGVSNEEVFQRGLKETLERLLGAGKRVIFVHPVPELDFDPIGRCLAGRPATLLATPSLPCAIAREEVERHQASYRTSVRELLRQFPQVEEVDPMGLFCDTKLCYGMHAGQLLYRDHTHLSISGSELVASLLTELIKSTGQPALPKKRSGVI